jgi:hypothetical protein
LVKQTADEILVASDVVFLRWRRGGVLSGRGHAEQAPAAVELLLPVAVSEETVITNPPESVGQNVEQKAPNEFLRGQAHGSDPTSMPVVLPLKTDLIVIHGEQAIVRNRDAVGVTSHVVEDLLWSGKRAFGVDDPFGLSRRRQIAGEPVTFAEIFQCVEEAEFAGIERTLEVVQKQATEQAR